jgi:hypothetical protein
VSVPVAPVHSTENIVRGTLFALIVIPVGVALWAIIWSFGIVAAIVAFVVAYGAVWLYRKGSGGDITRAGAFISTAIVIVTLLLAFWVGLVVDYVRAVVDQVGISPMEALQSPAFWPAFNSDFAELVKINLPSFGFAILFGALGSFRVLRSAFRQAAQTQTSPGYLFGEAPAAPGSPEASTSPYVAPVPPAQPQLNPESTGTISSAPDDTPPTRS